ncbi:hypothetical protein OURE66S_03300 [Oligella ureolytica]
MNKAKILLVRSPSELLEQDMIGHGWSQVNFSEANSLDELFSTFHEKKLTLGRRRNQIKRFFSVKEGDIVVVPLSRSIAIGHATGKKHYGQGITNGANRIEVNFLRHENNKSVIRIPRRKLTQALSSRLKIRMSVIYLEEFQDEIHRLIEEITTNGATQFDTRMDELESKALQELKNQLLTNIQSGKTYLESGGFGLEKLVMELLQTEGYGAKILAKTTYEGKADADILAIREDRFTSTTLLVQVKHHSGYTGFHAVRQLEAIEDETTSLQKWVITTGSMKDELKEQAETQGINIMEGEELVDWIIKQINLLSPSTLQKLGLSSPIPMILID